MSEGVDLLHRLLQGTGAINYALKDAVFRVFVVFYYKQALGLSGTLTGNDSAGIDGLQVAPEPGGDPSHTGGAGEVRTASHSG